MNTPAPKQGANPKTFSLWWPVGGAVAMLAATALGAILLQHHQTVPALGPVINADGTPDSPDTAQVMNKAPDCLRPTDGSKRIPPSGPCVKAQKPRVLSATPDDTANAPPLEGRQRPPSTP